MSEPSSASAQDASAQTKQSQQEQRAPRERIPDALLAVLICPQTQLPLHRAADALVARLNARAAAGTLRNQAGVLVREALDEGLLRSDEAVVYPVREGIPILLEEEALPLQAQENAAESPVEPV